TSYKDAIDVAQVLIPTHHQQQPIDCIRASVYYIVFAVVATVHVLPLVVGVRMPRLIMVNAPIAVRGTDVKYDHILVGGDASTPETRDQSDAIVFHRSNLTYRHCHRHIGLGRYRVIPDVKYIAALGTCHTIAPVRISQVDGIIWIRGLYRPNLTWRGERINVDRRFSADACGQRVVIGHLTLPIRHGEAACAESDYEHQQDIQQV